jgi:hypothetical protein
MESVCSWIEVMIERGDDEDSEEWRSRGYDEVEQ